MTRLEIKRQMGRADVAAVTELLQVAGEVDGHPALDEHQWLDLVHGGRHDFAGLVAWEPGHDHPVGYAQITREESATHEATWALEYVVDPHHRQPDLGIAQTLLDAALGLVGEAGGGHVHLWVPKPTPATDDLAASVGLRRGRELRQLRRPLPMDAHATVPVRPFVPGQDEAAWLEVNNRAFHWHPEQGGWDLETLRNRQEQPWFDPAGFLLHERDGKLAAFCWTKVHAHHEPPLGEIYVIAVDPGFRGHGLGRELVLAGLDHLAARGLTVGMLYVDADNAGALRLYEDLGFTCDHVDRAYVGDVAPATRSR
ncbi:MAG TPA: mycothiol synthase [Acidimicrobiales bacterium]|nr:mycothiol synthase [Acidimicrobiales bacterium]